MNNAAAAVEPTPVPPMKLSGLEPVSIGEGSLFVNIGERTNVTGSKAFARLILNGEFEKALAVARQQVENGAQVIDINMDEAMLDSKAAKVSGGVSNVSFSFRGNDPVREAIHTVFLYHAIQAGMDMGIVNAGMVGVYDDLEPELRERVEDVVLNRRVDAGERLVEVAENAKGAAKDDSAKLAWRARPVDERLSHALVHGINDFIVEDTEEVWQRIQAA